MRTRLLVSLSPSLLVFLACLFVYTRTAAPSVMGGDSAEFQMAAPLLGVPHPTTYPLYILVGKLFTVVIPFGDLARRVTLVSAFTAALAAALMFVLAWRVTRSVLAGLLSALALAVTPGLWNAATMAEVYGMLAALIAAAWLSVGALARWRAGAKSGSGGRSGGSGKQGASEKHGAFLAALAAFLAGLGVSHHGLFVFTAFPVVAVALLRYCFAAFIRHPSFVIPSQQRIANNGQIARRLAVCALGFGLGLTPWLFPLIQYARFGPFTGEDYGLPRHYFWGAPPNWASALGMVSGGPMRGGVFRLPTIGEAATVLRLLAQRLWFEFGPLGLVLGLIGAMALARRNWRAWLGGAWIACGTLVYLLLLGPAVQDAPIFTLPLLLPWALWVGVGGHACASRLKQKAKKASRQEALRLVALLPCCLLVVLTAATLAWGYTRLPYADKRHLNIWREWGQNTLVRLPANAVVIAHWEQGMVLQYLVQAEQQRRDVWIDVVEPGDDPWEARARRRYAKRPVLFAGSEDDVRGIAVDAVWRDSYADLFRWRGP